MNCAGIDIVLYRCGCPNCDTAERELTKLAQKCKVNFEARRVEGESGERLAGWATPVVYVNGIEISHYTISPDKWHRAADTPVERKTLRGEIVDYDCFVKEHARGPEHRECAEYCVNELKLPLGLLTPNGELYQLVAGLSSPVDYESLKEMMGREVEVTGDIFQWETKRTLTVRLSRQCACSSL